MRRHDLAALIALAGLVLIVAFSGCSRNPAPEVLTRTDPAPMLGGQKDKDETIGDAAKTIGAANRRNPDVGSREIIGAQVARIMQALQGAGWKAVEATVGQLVAERDAAQAATLGLKGEIDDLREQLRKAKDDAQRAAFLGVVRVFAVLGGALTLAGVLVFLWSTYKRAGILLAVAGPVVGGSGLLWGKPWFVLMVGTGVILVGVAVGIRYAWAVLDADRNGRIDMLERRKPVDTGSPAP